MSKSRIPLLSVSVLGCALYSACSTLPARDRAYDPSLCNRGAAYEAGFNDGQDGHAMGSSFLDSCREDLRAQGQDGYRAGYESGRQRLEERMKAMNSSPQPPAPPTTVNTNNGVQINIGTGQPVATPPNQKAWYCTVHAFTNDFEAFGPTQMETHQLAIQSCMRQNHPMHCQEVQCKPNQ